MKSYKDFSIRVRICIIFLNYLSFIVITKYKIFSHATKMNDSHLPRSDFLDVCYLPYLSMVESSKDRPGLECVPTLEDEWDTALHGGAGLIKYHLKQN